MGSKAPKSTTQTNTVKLGPEQQAIADLAAPLAEQYAQTPIQLPAGSGIAGFNPYELQAQQLALSTAQGGGQGLADQSLATNRFLLDPALLNPESNPALGAHGEAITRNLTQNLTDRILPSLRAGSTVAGGAYSGGNTRGQVAEGLAAGRTSQAAGDALANLYNQAYSTNIGALGDALRVSPLTQAGALTPSQTVGGVGAQNRAFEQATLDESRNRFLLEQSLPLIQAKELYGLISGIPGGSGVSTVVGAQPGTNPILGGLGGAATGASTGFMLGGPPGAAIGGGLGLLAALLSR